MKKHIIILVAILCIACICTILCVHFTKDNTLRDYSPTEPTVPPVSAPLATTENGMNSDNIWIETQQYVHTDGNVTYAADIAYPDTQSILTPSTKAYNFSTVAEEILPRFLPKVDIDYPNGWSTTAEGEGFYSNTDESQRITTSPWTFSYITDLGHNLQVMPINQYELIYFYPETEFSWGTRTDYAKKAVELLKAIGIQAKVEQVYAITTDMYEKAYQTELPYMEEELKNGITINFRNHIDYATSELAYVVVAKQTLNGLPIYNRDAYSSTKLEYIDGADIYLVFSQDGLENIEVKNLYAVEETGEAIQIITFEEAVNIFNNHINNQIILDEGLKIIYVGLEYMPDGSIMSTDALVKMKPMWVFRAENTHARTYEAKIIDYFIDAITGQVVIQ